MSTSPKQIASWLADLRKGSSKKRETAARSLASIDPDGARAILQEALAPGNGNSRAVQRSVRRCLQWVADPETARELLRDSDDALDIDRFPKDALVALYRFVTQAITRRKTLQKDIEGWLTRLAVLEPSPADLRAARPALDEDVAEAQLELLLTLIDDSRFGAFCNAAARGVRQLDVRRGNEILLERWKKSNESASALDAVVAWMRLGFPGEEQATKLSEALITELREAKGSLFEDAAEAKAVDKDLAKFAPEVPSGLAQQLLLALERHASFLPKTVNVAAKRVASIARAHGFDALIELLDDKRVAACHSFVAEHLAQSGTAGARAVIERSNRLSNDVMSSALVKLPAEDAWALLAPVIAEKSWSLLLCHAPAALRDDRWVETIELASPLISDRGRGMLVTMAQDPQNTARIEAIRQLDRIARRATDRIEKRYSLHALGETGHPEATLPLVQALSDPNLGDAAPLICTALGSCGDTRAIAVLEGQLGGRYDGFLNGAIMAIKERVNKLHDEVLAAASKDKDPMIIDLAQRAQNGDVDAAIVLEDALRERGLL